MRRGCRVARGCAAGGEGPLMIVPSGAVRVLVVTRPVDFRKGMDGLAALVRESLGADPFSGVVYVFRAKRADRVKLLVWDGTGLDTDSQNPAASREWFHEQGLVDAEIDRSLALNCHSPVERG